MTFINFLKKQKFYIISIVFTIIAIVFLSTTFRNNVEKNIENEMKSYLEEIRDNAIFILNDEIKQFENNLKSEARTIGLLGDLSDEELLCELHNFPKGDSMPRTYIMTLDGKIFSSLNTEIKKINPTDYKDVFNRQKIGISTPRFSETLKMTIVEISTPLYINGKYVGVLIGNYSIADFENLFESNFLDGNCSIVLTSKNGNLISKSGSVPIPKSFKGNLFDFYEKKDVEFINGTPQELKYDMLSNTPGYKVYTTENIIRYISYAPTGMNDWFISVVSTQDALSQHAKAIENYASKLVAGIVATMLFLLTVIIFARTREQRLIQRSLKEMATTDSLTKLLNKSTTEQSIDALLKTDSKAKNHAFLMIDIDGFKQVNDRLGHTTGDRILEKFGKDLRGIFKHNDILGRVGGDEFVVFMSNCEDKAVITSKALQICKLLRKTHYSEEFHNEVTKTSASIGIALYPKDGLNFNELYRSADVALYLSKNSGKDNYTFFQKK